VSEESSERVSKSFLRSLKKSARHVSLELEMSTMILWRVLRKRLEMKMHRLHLAQFPRNHHTRRADQSVARIRLSPGCVPCDQRCTHQTHVGYVF
jgi:hypothetical protein